MRNRSSTFGNAMRSPRYLVLLVCMLALLVSGCAQLATIEKTKRLEEAVKFYVKALRWDRLDVARGLLRDSNGAPIDVDLGALKGLQVTRYDFSINASNAAAGEALMSATFDYYFNDASMLKTVEQQAVWWWDARAEAWFLASTLPAFKR